MNTKKLIATMGLIGLCTVGSAFAVCSSTASASRLNDDQQAALIQKLSSNMTEQQVTETFGKPTSVQTVSVQGTSEKKKRWNYNNTLVGENMYSNANDSGRYSNYYGADKIYYENINFSVLFKNGKVVSWE